MRSAAAGLLAVVGCVLLPAVASARSAKPAQAAPIEVTGYPASTMWDAPPAGGTSELEPAITPAPDGTNTEWFVVSGQGQDLLAITPTGQQTVVARRMAVDTGAPDNYASVDADGYDWVLDNDQGPGNLLYAIGPADSPSPGLNPVARFGDYGWDMTLGPDGALYVSDSDGIFRCSITAAPSAVCTLDYIPPAFYTGAGAFAMGSGGNAVWFTDGMGDFGADIGGTFGGPYPNTGSGAGSADPGTIATAGNGDVYVASGAESTVDGDNDKIVTFSPGDPYQVSVAASGLGNVVSLTAGPDGNIWFLDTVSDAVGELNVSDGSVIEYGLPTPMTLPTSGWRIAAGPEVASASGTGEVFFTAQDENGNAEIGEVTGIPFPIVPGALAFKPSITVSKKRTAVVTLTCAGEGNAECVGSMALSVNAKLKVKVAVRTARSAGRARYRTVVQSKSVTLGNVSYSLGGGSSSRSTVTLSKAAYSLLEKVAGHRWTATVTSAATVGTVAGSTLTMTGPAPSKRKPKTKPKASGGKQPSAAGKPATN